MRIAWLGEQACHDPALVGGKAAQLSRLAARHRVPAGFCLTATAYQDALNAGGLSPALLDDLTAAYARLAAITGQAEPRVAVRSSALDEDGVAASFAGQHESYLNIVGLDAVAQAVRRCWASLRSERALAYRHQQGLTIDGARLAVLVQQLVPADVSAVLFSANPVTGSPEEMVITASWGLGESIVGGTITPDTYTVRKADLAVVSRQIGDKQRMTVPTAAGTQEVAVPRLLRGQLSLTDVQVVALARLGQALEDASGWPVDVECAFGGGHLVLLQCRPITTLGGSAAWRRGNAA